jgi:Asp-tRNA(Asn)/Glu-tRNA(Gln) amidotransferase A subunit family amidase
MFGNVTFHLKSTSEVVFCLPSCDSAQYRLKAAGAVLVAKLVTGSLAYDDIWYGGRTRNPWNIEEFTTGSSAGPAACTSAGMV